MSFPCGRLSRLIKIASRIVFTVNNNFRGCVNTRVKVLCVSRGLIFVAIAILLTLDIFVTPLMTCSHRTIVLRLHCSLTNDVVRQNMGRRRHQTPARSCAAPWRVSLSIRCDVKSVLPLVSHFELHPLASPAPLGPLWDNVTSSTKPEVHDLLQRGRGHGHG